MTPREQALHIWEWLRDRLGIPVMILIAIMAIYVAYSSIAERYRSWQVEQTAKRIEQFDQEARGWMNQTETLLNKIQKDHEETLSIVESINQMSEHIKTLNNDDKELNIKVEPIKQNYEAIRNAPRRTISPTERTSRSLDRREQRALSADAELYPDR